MGDALDIDTHADRPSEPRLGPGTAAQVGAANRLALRLIGRLAGGRPPAVFSTIARHRRLFRRWVPFAAALMPRGTLPRADTELVILRVAHNCRCDYESHHHRTIGLESGLSMVEIAAAAEGPGAGCFSERQAMLLRAADELHEEREISQELWDELSAALSDTELIELCMLVGHYEMLAMTLNSLGVTPEMDDEGRALLGAAARFAAGLTEVGDGVYAWLQPNGEVGESNAGLIVGRDESALIDTLWDLRLTRRMLAAMAEPTRHAPIRTLVNTHGDGDHCWGNQLLPAAEIIASEKAAADMRGEDPRALRLTLAAGRGARPLGSIPGAPGRLRDAGAFGRVAAQLSAYDFRGVELTFPTRTFEHALSVEVGGRTLHLEYLGPAHTPGDTIVHVPDARTVFAGDLVFVGVAPIMWVGTAENWIRALDRILELSPRVVVPGHGPVSDVEGVREMRAYWQHVLPAVRARIAQGSTPARAAAEIISSPEFQAMSFAGWDGHERLVASADTIARNDRGESGRVDARTRAGLLLEMARLAAAS